MTRLILFNDGLGRSWCGTFTDWLPDCLRDVAAGISAVMRLVFCSLLFSVQSVPKVVMLVESLQPIILGHRRVHLWQNRTSCSLRNKRQCYLSSQCGLSGQQYDSGKSLRPQTQTTSTNWRFWKSTKHYLEDEAAPKMPIQHIQIAHFCPLPFWLKMWKIMMMPEYRPSGLGKWLLSKNLLSKCIEKSLRAISSCPKSLQ